MNSTITLEKIKAIKDGLSHYFPFETGESSGTVFVNDTWSDLNKSYKWKGRDDYFTTLSELTGIQNLKEIKKATFILDELEKNISNITTAPEYSEASVADATRPESLGKTTISERTDEQIFTDAAKRNADIAKTRENQSKAVEDFKKRGEAIYAEQQKIQEQILKSKAAEPEIAKLKPLYIKVEEIEKVQFTPEEKTVFDEYRKEASENPEETVVKLAREIHSRADEVLKAQGLGQEEADFVVIKTAEKIVTELKSSELPEYVTPMAHIAINNTIYEKVQSLPTTVVSHQTQEVLLSSIGITSKFRFLPDVYLKNVTEVAFGPEVARTIFGSTYKVSVSEIPEQGFTKSFSFDVINEEGRQIQVQQNQTLETLKGLGQKEAKTFLFDQSATYFAKSSLGQKVLANPKAQVAFYSVFKGAGQTITWTSEGFVGNAVLRFAPEYAPILNIATGTRFVTPVMSLSGAAIGTGLAAQTAATATEIAFTGGIMASEAFLGGAGTAAAGAAAGTAIAPIVGTAIGAVAGAVGGKVFSEALSKLKVWWSNNKDVAGPAAAVGLGFGGLMLGGPTVGGVALLGGLAAVGSLGAFAAGAFNVLGFIGRSIGIAIATPVIVTLLVLPPLVAFIMLVINNSAYVVPYSSNVRSIGVKLGPTINGGVVSSCTESEATGKDITNEMASRIKKGAVNLLPQTVWGRADGICIKPLMIIIHWSGGHDNDDGNLRTYETLIARKLSCQLATDTNDVWLMEKFFEKQVEFPACASEWNTYSINNEVAGNNFTGNPPPPDLGELELAYDATCKIMEQYDIPWTKIYGHYQVPNSGKDDPGVDFLQNVFIPEIRKRCPNETPKNGR